MKFKVIYWFENQRCSRNYMIYKNSSPPPSSSLLSTYKGVIAENRFVLSDIYIAENRFVLSDIYIYIISKTNLASKRKKRYIPIKNSAPREGVKVY
jgi:hypothetical protein